MHLAEQTLVISRSLRCLQVLPLACRWLTRVVTAFAGRKAELEAALATAADGGEALNLDALHGSLVAAGCAVGRHQALTLFRALVRQAGGDAAAPAAQVPVAIAATVLCGGASLV